MKKSEIITILVIIIVTALFTVFYALPRISARVDFVSEKVEMTIEKTGQGYNLNVQGYYFMENLNPFPITRTIFFPIPTEYGHVLPDSLLVTNGQGEPGGDWEIHRGFEVFPHRLALDNSSFSFKYKFPARQISVMSCRYSQKLNADEFAYIVTTITDWGIPLQSARFEVSFPDGHVIDQSNYDFQQVVFDDTQTQEKCCLWRFDTVNFLPDEDIHFSFKALETSENKNPSS